MLGKTKDFSLHKSLILNRKVVGRNKHQNWTHYLTSINFIPLSVMELHVKIYLVASVVTIGMLLIAYKRYRLFASIVNCISCDRIKIKQNKDINLHISDDRHGTINLST
jgi:hypothetical protein